MNLEPIQGLMPHTVKIGLIQNDVFAQWAKTHNKYYTTHTEKEYRRDVFLKNLEWINEYNSNTSNSAQMGLNNFADLSLEEFRLLHSGGSNEIPMMFTGSPSKHHYGLSDLPIDVNWVKKGAVTPVKNQLNCGSSWAFAATGALEGLYYLTNLVLLEFSQQQLLDCATNLPPGQNACFGNGGTIEQMFQYAKHHGIESSVDYPYTGEVQNCTYNPNATVFNISGYDHIEPFNNKQLTEAVSRQPVSVMVETKSQEFQFYKSGILNSPWCGNDPDHSVLAVGYGTEGGLDYWILKNSWGESWGEKGYIKILRESVKNPGMCGIATMGYWPIA
jgi:hypothetical protein